MNDRLIEEHMRAKSAVTEDAIEAIRHENNFRKRIDLILKEEPRDACAMLDRRFYGAELIYCAIETMAERGVESAQKVVDRARELELDFADPKKRMTD